MKEYLTEREVAGLGIIGVRALQSWRLHSEGPPYIKVGRAIRYRISDIERWLSAQTVDMEAKRQAVAHLARPPE